MQERPTGIAGIIESILRGSTRILGCTSASLIVFNEPRREVTLRVGTAAESLPDLEQVEALAGGIKGASFSFDHVGGSLVYRSWKQRAVLETSSLVDLAGNAFGTEILEPAMDMIGDRRFICVPALTGDRCQGVVVFDKAGGAPFSRQQREVLLLYAQRIGDIIESDPDDVGAETSPAGAQETTRRAEPAGDQLIHMALGESAPVVMVDPDSRITSSNDAAERLFGFPSGKMVNRSVEDLFKDPQQIRALLNHQFLFLADGHFEEGTVLRRRNGQQFPGRVETLLLADNEDRVVGFLVLFKDQSALMESLGDRQGLDRLMRQERLATMGEMAAQLAHEIRNPLVAIGATLEYVAGDLEEGRDVRENIADVRKEISRIDMILKAYLSLAARHRSSLAVVDLAQVLEDASRILDGSRKSTGKTFTSQVPAGTTVLADVDGLRHVFFNLLLNALESLPWGGTVTCSAITGPDEVILHVDDTGPGLNCDPEECFQTFFTTKNNGTGLGLTVCRKIMEAHGGTVRLENREEGGCRAVVTLPRKVRT